MILKALTPTRISLFGGGTDVPTYADTYGGLCINMAINLRQQITMYSDDDIFNIHANTFPHSADPDFYYTFLEEYKINGRHHTKLQATFDGLIKSGLGSSASAGVAMMGLINKRLNLGLSTSDIAMKAWEVEVNKIGVYGGRQDQFASAFGGVNVMEFTKEGVSVTPLAKGFIEPLLPSLLLFYAGSRESSDKMQRGFQKLSEEQIQALNNIKRLALSAVDPIAQGDIERVGELLNQAWEYKKASNKGISNPKIDEIYNKALECGAFGGKILGAGGGGYMLFVCPTESQKGLIESLGNLGVTRVDFTVDWNGLEVVEENEY